MGFGNLDTSQDAPTPIDRLPHQCGAARLEDKGRPHQHPQVTLEAHDEEWTKTFFHPSDGRGRVWLIVLSGVCKDETNYPVTGSYGITRPAVTLKSL